MQCAQHTDVYLNAWINSIHFGVVFYCILCCAVHCVLHSWALSLVRIPIVLCHTPLVFYCMRTRWCKTPPKRIGAELAVYLQRAFAHGVCVSV